MSVLGCMVDQHVVDGMTPFPRPTRRSERIRVWDKSSDGDAESDIGADEVPTLMVQK